MLPVLVAQLVVLLKDTSLGFIIGYFELLRQARSLVEFFTPTFGNQYTFQIYVAAGLLYIIVNPLLSWLARYAERRSRRNKKAAATAEIELSPDLEMGGGGGVLPPKQPSCPTRHAADDTPYRYERDWSAPWKLMHAAGRRTLPPVPRAGGARAGFPPATTATGTATRRATPPPSGSSSTSRPVNSVRSPRPTPSSRQRTRLPTRTALSSRALPSRRPPTWTPPSSSWPSSGRGARLRHGGRSGVAVVREAVPAGPPPSSTVPGGPAPPTTRRST